MFFSEEEFECPILSPVNLSPDGLRLSSSLDDFVMETSQTKRLRLSSPEAVTMSTASTPSSPQNSDSTLPNSAPPDGLTSAPSTNQRFNAKMMLLTWSQAPSLTKEMIMTHLKSLNAPIQRIAIGQEHHQDEGTHFHACMEVETSRSWRPLQFRIAGITADVKTHKRGKDSYARSLRRVWNYVTKEDPSPLIEGDPPPEEKKSSRNADFKEAADIAVRESVDAAKRFLQEKQPYEMLIRRDAICRGLYQWRKESVSVEAPTHSLSDFERLPELPPDWRTLYLWGTSGSGKTSYARALLPNATIVRHRNQLVSADFSQGLILDDFDVSHWPPTAVIHLVDYEVESGIDVKHGHVVIPAYTRKIITMNHCPEYWIPSQASPEQKQAVLRRMHEIHVGNKLFNA